MVGEEWLGPRPDEVIRILSWGWVANGGGEAILGRCVSAVFVVELRAVMDVSRSLSRRGRWGVGRWVVVASLLSGWVMLGGCGDDGGAGDRCADVSCERGVCDSETGECRNAESCQPGGIDAGSDVESGSTDPCLRGFACREGECEAVRPCSSEGASGGSGEGECERGVCRKGACVNASTCESRSDCLAGLGCSESGECRDLCAGKQCDRGVCESETGECVNPETCDPEDSETPSCLESAVCLDDDEDGTAECLEEEAYCDWLDCGRGRCSFEQRQCVDRETCTADADCVEGNYCEEILGECKTNACEASESESSCPRGVCDQDSGECRNPNRCDASTDCLPDHRCVENRCVERGRACGPDGCPGTQICEYTEATLTASCVENPDVPCRNARDCTGTSVCRDGACVAPEGCTPDDLEPNDTTQVDFLENAFRGTVSANLCNAGGSGDVDRYAFDLEEARGDALRGQLYVDFSVERIDVGQGAATLKMTDQSGRILAEKSTNTEGRIHFERPVTALEISSLQFVVTGSGLGPAGLRYTLFAGVAPQATVRACRQAPTLVPDAERSPAGPATGHTGERGGRSVDGTCVDEGAEASDSVYTFTLEERSYVSLALRPEPTADLTLALRRYCGSLGSELGCSDIGGTSGGESLGRELRPGTYTVVVQGDRAGEGGAFELSFAAEPVICNASQDRCTGGGSALICRDNGTTFNELECESSCDMQTGRCERQPGDVCYAPVEAGESYESTIDWTLFGNTYEPERGCVGESQDTDGPDVLYRVEVPAGEVLEADLSFDSPAGDGSLYLLRNCGDAAGSCVAWADSDESSESLTYVNDTPYNQRRYLVADSKAGTSFESTAISIETNPPVCEPGETRCAGDDREVCNSSGTGFDATTCTYGCDSGECKSPAFDTCGGAIDLTGGGMASASFVDLSDDYRVSAGCAGDESPGPDGVYRVDLQAGEVMTADVTAVGSRSDPMVYVAADCTSASALEASCRRGVDEGYEGDDESLTFRAPGDISGTRTFWVVVDSDGTSGPGGYEIDLSTQSSVCVPGERQCASGSSDVIEMCGQFGLQYASYTCQGSTTACQSGTTGASCPEPTGDQCIDPISVGKNETVTGLYDGSNELTIPAGTTGACEVGQGAATDGPERIYSVDLASDDLLTARLETTHDDSMLYVMQNCVRPNSCQTTSLQPGGDKTVQYLAERDETVYVVVDSAFDSGNDLYSLELSTTPDTTCIPGSIRCTDPSTVSICNDAGTSLRSQYTCSTNCTAGACEPPGLNTPGSLPHDACGTAPNIGAGTVVSGRWSRLNGSMSLPEGVCTDASGAGPEAVYEVSMLSGETLKVQLESFGPDQPFVYLIRNCADLSSCPAGAVGRDGGAELMYTAQSSETVYVVADSTQVNASDKFRLSMERLAPECSPGSRLCTDNGAGLQVCQNNGLYESRRCDGGCQSGSCATPSGDWCPDPVPLTVGASSVSSPGATYEGAFDAFEDRLTMETTPACGIHTDDDATEGPDAFFEVTGVSSGETLVADLQTDVEAVNMYVMNGCPLGDSTPSAECEWGVSDDHRLRYLNDGGSPIYLVVDAQSRDVTGDFEVALWTESGTTCQPGGGSCSGSSTQTLNVCAADGSEIERTVDCAAGCSAGGVCQTASPAPETCATAMNVGVGTRLRDTTERYTDDLNPSCVAAGGSDAVYSVEVPAGESMQAEVTPVDGGMDPSVYVLETCGSPSSCQNADATENTAWQRGAAVTGYHNDSSQMKTVTVVVDHGADGGEYELDIEVSQPSCAAGAVGDTTCLDDERVGTCTDYRLYRSEQCDFGCNSAAQSCESVPNDTCSGAVSLQARATYGADIGEYTDSYNPGTASQSCLGGGQAGGPDAVYQVDLNAGDVFDATVQTPGDGVLWATTACSTAASSCVAAASGGSEQRLTFTASTSGTHYIVVDTDVSGGTTPTGQFALEVDHAGPAVCSAGTRRCTGAMGNQLAYCQKTGLSKQVRTCAGTCSSGACTKNHGDFCEDAKVAVGGDSFTFDYSDFSDVYSLSESSCVGFETAGNDRVFEVELQPGETLTVDATSQNSNDWVQAYVVERCGREQTVEGACVKGVDFGGASGTLTYAPTLSSSETYFVVIDGWLEETSGSVTVDFTIQ